MSFCDSDKEMLHVKFNTLKPDPKNETAAEYSQLNVHLLLRLRPIGCLFFCLIGRDKCIRSVRALHLYLTS